MAGGWVGGREGGRGEGIEGGRGAPLLPDPEVLRVADPDLRNALDLSTTTSQKCKAVSRRARIQGSYHSTLGSRE